MNDTGPSDAEKLAQESSHLPLEDRVYHKHWKVREMAYAELGDLFESAEDDADIFKDYGKGIVKLIRDSNAAAQLSGLSTVIKFAQSAPLPVIRSIAKEAGKGLAESGLKGRPSNKKLASEALVAMVGAECGLIIVESFATYGFKSKVAKVVVATANAICDALSTYGKAQIPIKEICKHVPKILSDKNKDIRAAGKQLAVLLNYWTKQPAQTLMPDVKLVILKELEPLFAENSKKPKPKPTKLTRSKIKRVRKAGADGDGDDSASDNDVIIEEEEDDDDGIDLWESLQPMKIAVETDDKGKVIATEMWPKAFASEQWNHHKAAMDAAASLIADNRIMPGTQNDLIPRFRDILKKSKMAVVIASSAKLAIALMQGLRKDFPKSLAKDCTSGLIFRLKETSRVVVEPVSNALDMLHQKRYIKIFEYRNDIDKAAKIKSPKSRVNLLKWLARCITKGMPSADLKGDALKYFGDLFLNQSDDRSTDVRDAALYGIAALQVVAGAKNTAKLIDKLEKQKQTKVAANVTKIKEARKAEKAAAKTGDAPKSPETKDSKPSGSTPKSAASKSKTKKKLKAESAPKPPPVLVSDDEGESGLASEAALEAAASRYEGFDPENWTNKFAKERAACAKLVHGILKEKETLDAEESALLVTLLAVEPGMQDSSFLAVKEKLPLLGVVADKCTAPLPRRTLRPVLLPAIEKLGDIKCSKVAEGVLFSVAEATSGRFFFQALAETAKETINARAQLNIMKFAGKFIDEFGIPAVKPEDVASLVATLLAREGSATLKKATISLACQASIRTPSSFRDMLVAANASSEGLDDFDKELEKYKSAPPPDAPTRKKKEYASASTSTPAPVESEEIEDEKSAEPEVIEEPVPEVSSRRSSSTGIAASPLAKKVESSPEPARTPVRISVSDSFTEESPVMMKLQSKDWRTRGEGLEEVETILASANNFVHAEVGRYLFPLLKKRLADNNVNVAASAYGTMTLLVSAMGPEFVVHLKTVMPTILEKGCTNLKTSIRTKATTCLNTVYDAVGMAPLVVFMHHPFKVKPDKLGRIRTDFLEWIMPRITGEVGAFIPEQGELEPLIQPCVACLQDNITVVRQLGEKLLDVLVQNVGFPAIDAKVPNQGSIRRQLKPVLSKYNGQDGPSSVPSTPIPRTPRSSVRTKTPRTGGYSNKRPQSMMVTPRTGDYSSRPQSMMVTPRTGDLSNRLFEGGSSAQHSGKRRPMSVSGFGAAPPLFEEEEADQVLIPNNGRAARGEQFMYRKNLRDQQAADEGKFAKIREDIEDLHGDLKDCVSPALYERITAPANRFQFHIEAMDSIKSFMNHDPETTVLVADVILRWAAFRIDDSRTPSTVLTAIVEFVNSICEILLSSGVKLDVYEASSLIPAIVAKCGSNRESIRKRMIACLLSIGEVIPVVIMLRFLVGSLQRPIGKFACEEVAKEICQLIDKVCGSGEGLPGGLIELIGKVAVGEDEVTGRAAASCIARAHHHFGDDLWELLGSLTDNEARLIEERLAQANSSGVQLEQATPSKFASPAPQSYMPPTPVHHDIRPSDYRLSIAPEPAGNIQSTLNNILSTKTPAKIRPLFGRDAPGDASPSPVHETPENKPDASDVVGYVLYQLQSDDRNDQLEGLSVLYGDLQVEDSKLRKLPSDVIPKLSRCFSDALNRIERREGNEEDPLILKRFLNAIMAYARDPEIIVELDQMGMENLLNDLLHAMVPDEVRGIEDWKQVRRGVNLVLLKVLEACKQNMLFTALIRVLQKSLTALTESHSVAMETRISSKCTFCINSLAKASQKGFGECNLDELLNDIHEFLLANPVRPEENTPSEEQTVAIRLLKTIVDKLIGEVGLRIKEHLPLIGGKDESQLARYIEMKLEDGSIQLPDDTNNNNDRIGREEGNTTGEKELDVKRKSRPYSARGLGGRVNSGGGQVYIERLKEIQRRYGLQNNNEGDMAGEAAATPSPEATNIGSSSSNRNSTTPKREERRREEIEKPTAAEMAAAMKETREVSYNRAAALRERMARIRSGK